MFVHFLHFYVDKENTIYTTRYIVYFTTLQHNALTTATQFQCVWCRMLQLIGRTRPTDLYMCVCMRVCVCVCNDRSVEHDLRICHFERMLLPCTAVCAAVNIAVCCCSVLQCAIT